MLGMTGYSQREFYKDDLYIYTEIKTVNHRFLEINLSMPHFLGSMEIPVRELIQKFLKRGKVDVSCYLKIDRMQHDVVVDYQLAGQYIEGFKNLIQQYDLKDDVKLSHLVRFEDIIKTDKKRDFSEYWPMLEESLKINLGEVIKMRQMEGQTTGRNLNEIIETIKKNVGGIALKVPEMEKLLFDQMKKKIAELTGDRFDETRILSEAAILVSKSCINEEVERLKMHVREFQTIAGEDHDIGKRLDFLCQEMHREINTIGSKVTLSELTGSVISIKNDIEKLREQIRNIE